MKIINDTNILLNENICPKIIRRLDKWGRLVLPREFKDKIFSNYLKVSVNSNFLILSNSSSNEGIKANKNGRIMIPKQIRENLKWNEGNLIDIYLYKIDCIVMQKSKIQHINYKK